MVFCSFKFLENRLQKQYLRITIYSIPSIKIVNIFAHICTFLYARQVTSVVSDSLWPMDCSPPGSSVHGLLQARILEWVVMSCSRGSFPPRDQAHISCNSCITGFTTEPMGKPVFLYFIELLTSFVEPFENKLWTLNTYACVS